MNKFITHGAIACLILFSQSAFAYHIKWIIHGIHENVLKNVKTHLELTSKDFIKPPTESALTQYYQTVKKNTLDAMQPYGYFKPKITTLLQRHKKYSTIVVSIKPGRQMQIRALDLQIIGHGRHHPAFTYLRDHFSLEAKTPLNIEEYNRAKQNLFHTAQTHGFINAKFTKSQIQIDIIKYEAKIILIFDTEDQFFIGDIHYSDTPLSEDFIFRFIKLKPNTAFSTDAIFDAQEALMGSNYFEQVKVTPEFKKSQNHRIPIDIHLTMRKAQAYTFGLGYGTDTGPRARVGSEWRYLNDYGHHMKALLQLSDKLDSLQAIYVIPGKHPLSDQYQLSASVYRLKTPTEGKSEYSQFSIAYINHWNEWQQTMALNALIERNFDHPNKPDNTSKLIFPRLLWHKLHAKNRINTKNGYSLDLTLQGATDSFLSDINFIQAKAAGKYIKSINGKSRLILRGTLGYTESDNINYLPLSLQFLTGGSQSVRGYSYQSLGPGKYLVIGSAEYQHKLYDKWSIATYYDAGNAMSSLSSHLVDSIGIGFVRSSAIGQIRISAARALSAPGKPFRFVFSMGPDL